MISILLFNFPVVNENTYIYRFVQVSRTTHLLPRPDGTDSPPLTTGGYGTRGFTAQTALYSEYGCSGTRLG